MAGISIAFASDVRSFLKGTSDVEGALEDVSGSLDDLARDADRQGRRVGEALDDAAAKGEDAARDLERTFRDTFDDVRRDADRSTRDVADTTRRNMGRAGDAVGEFRSEAVQNIAETASSFDGSMDSIADMVQGTFGGLATLPGVGLGVAALGALGGVVYNLWRQSAEDVEERTQEMFDAMVESGLNYLTQAQTTDALKALYDDDGKMDQLRADADALGVTVEALAAAYVTSGAARETVFTRQAELIAAEEAAIAALREQVAALPGDERTWQSEKLQTLQMEITERTQVVDRLREATGLVEEQIELGNDAAATAESFRQANAAAMLGWRQEHDANSRAVAEYAEAVGRIRDQLSQPVRLTVDTSAAERALRNFRPVITGTFRAGQAVV